MKFSSLSFLIISSLVLFSCGESGEKGSGEETGFTEGEYFQSFYLPASLAEIEASDPSMWKLTGGEPNGYALELLGKSDYQPPVRSPHSVALISGKVFGSFTLEADLLQTGKEYGHRDMCIFFGFQNPSQFYYVHLASIADDHAHNMFVVDNEPRVKFASEVTGGISWGDSTDTWHHFKLERNVDEGSVKVYFDDMDNPVMTGKDDRFKEGQIGFGSFDDSGMIDNIRVTGEIRTDNSVKHFSGFLPE